MKATINNAKAVNTINPAHRNAKNFREEFTALELNELGNLVPCVTLRIYSTESRSYACCWIHGDDGYNYGSGYAGGYGYHRASAAAEEALTKAGVKLSEDINGRGDSAIIEAVKATAEAAKPGSRIFVHHAHA